MAKRIMSSYPMRFAFVLAAVVAAMAIIHYRLLVKGDSNLLRANRCQTGN